MVDWEMWILVTSWTRKLVEKPGGLLGVVDWVSCWSESLVEKAGHLDWEIWMLVTFWTRKLVNKSGRLDWEIWVLVTFWMRKLVQKALLLGIWIGNSRIFIVLSLLVNQFPHSFNLACIMVCI